jgi:hypothetical protein
VLNKPDQKTFLDTILLKEDGDILWGFILLVVGWLASLANWLMGTIIGINIAAYFLISFLVKLSSGDPDKRIATRFRTVESDHTPTTVNAPITDEPTVAEKIKSIHRQNDLKCPSCGATVLPIAVKCSHCGSVLIATLDLPRPEKWADVELRQSIQLTHPERGNLALVVIYRMYYGELWQAQIKLNVPWTLTGNYYVGLGLENGIFLLNWQGRFYLLDSDFPLTDKEINQTFARPAREFAASNQSKNVSFTYDKTVWTIEDIGRFRIEWVEGEGANAAPSAVGRFIHAKAGRKALVVEDYQSNAGGADTLWVGYQIAASDIRI